MSSGFHATIAAFLFTETETVLGYLSSHFAETGLSSQRSTQVEAWRTQVEILRYPFTELCDQNPEFKNAYLIFEFEIPRRQKRPDLVLLFGDSILLIEFKVGANTYDSRAILQVKDYAFNLRDFHSGSLNKKIFTALCATEAATSHPCAEKVTEYVYGVSLVNALEIGHCIKEAFSGDDALRFNAEKWLNSDYRPTPTIIEAAERLYSKQSVREISHSYADNLTTTTDTLLRAVAEANANQQHTICFVTGVPGAGKTLTGLNVVHDPNLRQQEDRSGIFLSGNGPLVNIIREALAKNAQSRGMRKADAKHEVTTFIQNVHQFIRHYRSHSDTKPHEQVVVFDEAQRAWDLNQMARKQKIAASEASLILDVMERFSDWSVIIALVGGGQEIFLGEAGLREWGNALSERKINWKVVASPEVLYGGSSVAGNRLFDSAPPTRLEVQPESSVHLTVSVRSIRAQKLAGWVNSLLSLDSSGIDSIIPNKEEFPIFVTRDLAVAKGWLKRRGLGDPHLRKGLVATSEDQRLRAYGLERSSGFRLKFPFEKWFLENADDCRSSHALEVAASEFECQGLELDWVGVCWGGDLTFSEDKVWEFRKFRGSRWQRCMSEAEQVYILNRYRVLLTRSRLGMVIWVPPGIEGDPTLERDRFDRIYDYLLDSGVSLIEEDVA